MSGGFPFLGGAVNGQHIGAASPGSDFALTLPSSNNTKGAWAQLVASTTYDATYIIVQFSCVAAFKSAALDIGIGASGSEVVLLPNLIAQSGQQNDYEQYTYAFPVNIPAGTRIAGRYQISNASGAHDCYCNVALFDGDFTRSTGAAGVDAVGFSSSTTLGTAVTPGNGSFGSFAQLTSSTSRDYLGFVMAFDLQGASYSGHSISWEVAVGASSSEKTIQPILASRVSVPTSSASTTIGTKVTPFIPVAIPSGSRVSARGQTDATQAFGLTLYGVWA